MSFALQPSSPAILLETSSQEEQEQLNAALTEQTIPVELLSKRSELTNTTAPGVLYLPFTASLTPTLLENLQQSLETKTHDFILPCPLAKCATAGTQGSPTQGSQKSPLAQEKSLEQFCESYPLPALYTTPSLLLKLLEKATTGTNFSTLIKHENLRGLLIAKPYLHPLRPEQLPELSPLTQSSQNSKHTHLSLQPAFISYAPLSPEVLPPWQTKNRVKKQALKAKLPKEKRPHLIQLIPYLAMGGADKFVLDLCEQLPRHTHWQVSLLTTDSHRNEWLDRARELTPDVHELPAFLPPCALPSAILAHARTRQAQALLLTHSFLGYRLLPWLAHQLPELTLADYLHIEHPDWKSGGHPRLSILQQDYLDASLYSSEHLKNWSQEHGRDTQRQSVIHTNIDTEVWNPASFDAHAIRKEYQIPPEHRLILVAMRMAYQKQPELLMELLQQLEAENLPFTCLVCGDGEEFAQVQAFHQSHQLKQTHLLGAKSNAQVKRLMAAADIFLLPTRMEGIALSLFEAMAMQCVPVAARVGGQAELISPETGFLIERTQGREKEKTAYLEALRTLLHNKEALDQKKLAARQRIETHFSLRQMAENLGKALDQASQTRAPRPPLTPRQAQALAIEALETSQLEQQAETRKGELKAEFQQRIKQRDEKILKLKQKLSKAQAELEQLHTKRNKQFWRKLEHQLRGKKSK